MENPIIGILGVVLAAVAFLAVLWLVPTLSRMRRRLEKAGIDMGDEEEEALAKGGSQGLPPELIAVITAAVAAASGLGSNEFRVVGVNRVEGSGSFNTPVWGHVDRLSARPFAR